MDGAHETDSDTLGLGSLGSSLGEQTGSIPPESLPDSSHPSMHLGSVGGSQRGSMGSISTGTGGEASGSGRPSRGEAFTSEPLFDPTFGSSSGDQDGFSHSEATGMGSSAGEEEVQESELTQPYRDFILQTDIQRRLMRMFRGVLMHKEEGGDSHYRLAITSMVNSGSASLEVKFEHISVFKVLPQLLLEAPIGLLDMFDRVATEVAEHYFPKLTLLIHSNKVKVRIVDFPVQDKIRGLRNNHIHTFVRVTGVVTRRSQVFPRLDTYYFNCNSCSMIIGPMLQRAEQEPRVQSCPSCQSGGPFKLNTTKSIYRNYQMVSMQESPGDTPAGRLPRRLEVIMQDDMKDICKPGDEIDVTGTYQANYDIATNHRMGFPVFSVSLLANSVVLQTNQQQVATITEEEASLIERISKEKPKKLRDIIVRSMAPSLHGLEHIKFGLALALFGGVEKENKGTSRIRGDINVLLMGDPGTAKSQLLKYCEKTSSRAVYTTGKGSTAVGLTAAVTKDPNTGDWALEGGAMVIADKGVCLIDEFDKMNESDRTSIHEAMEQQTISIAKAGIVATLQARCSVIAAANPIGGSLNEAHNFSENVNLTAPILQRFDLTYVIKDAMTRDRDLAMAKFITGNHQKVHPEVSKLRQMMKDSRSEQLTEEQERELQESYARETEQLRTSQQDFVRSLAAECQKEEEERMVQERMQLLDDSQGLPDDYTMPQSLLKKYFAKAKTILPSLDQVGTDKLTTMYEGMRQSSQNKGKPIIAVRHYESILRLSQAHARMHLRAFVNENDVDVAVKVFHTSFQETLPKRAQEQWEKKMRELGYGPSRH